LITTPPTDMEDRYPTRVEGKLSRLPRLDPVLHGGLDAEGPLSKAQLEDFEEKGFLFMPPMFSEQEIAVYTEEQHRLLASEQVRQSEQSVTEPASGDIRTIYGPQSMSEVFETLYRDERLVRVARQILGSDVYLHQARVNFKPGFVGQDFYWHSDFETWHAEDGMKSMRALDCILLLEENMAYNAPLMLIPGSHKYFVQCEGYAPGEHYRMNLQKQEFGFPSREHLRSLTDKHGIFTPLGTPGSVLFFDCNLIHGSNSNITPYPRSNAFFVYNSVENALGPPFAMQHERPWYMAAREPEAIRP